MIEQDHEFKFAFFRWNPRWLDFAPIIIWIFLGAIMQTARLAGPLAPIYIEWMNPLIDLLYFVFPIVSLRLLDKEKFAFIGLSKRRVPAALIIGLPFGLFLGWMSVSRSLALGQYIFFPPVLNLTAYALAATFHLLAVEFFYRGWLTSSLERSFGFLAAIIISGLLYSFSPLLSLGLDPALPSAFSSCSFYWSAVFPFTFLIGVLLAAATRLTRNLLAPVLAMFPQTFIGDLVQNGAAHRIAHPLANIVGFVALTGIVIITLWITKSKKTDTAAMQP